MNRSAAVLLAGLGVLTVALAVADYVAATSHETEREQDVLDLVDSYRFGTAERTLEDEQAMLEAHANHARERALQRLQVACAIGLVLGVLGAAFVRRRRRDGQSDGATASK
jgi:ElaB/YqjD/DUF883 family membrane-anchored ribosome-binding protein